MWSRNEAKIDMMLNSMTINLNMFGVLIKCRVVRNEDGSQSYSHVSHLC